MKQKIKYFNSIAHVLGFEDNFSDSFNPFFSTRDGICR